MSGNTALNQSYVTGYKRTLLEARMARTIAFRYLGLLISGEINLKQYIIFLKRIMLLAEVLRYNKAVRINDKYKIHLYLPAFPSEAFYQAIDKFFRLDGKTIPMSVVFSMTKACGYNCQHCYQKKDAGEDLDINRLIKVAKDIQDMGVSLFDIEGGEPLLRFERLLTLVQNIDARSEVWINTTGHSLTPEKARQLKESGLFGAMVSIHHWLPEKHNEFVSFKGAFDIAVNAIKIFQSVGVNTVINCVASSEMINDNGIGKIMDLAKKLNCSFVQIIHEKPSGGWINRGNTVMEEDLLDDLCKMHLDFNTEGEFKDYPSLSMQVFESSVMAFGCTAGGIERFYVNANGEVQPCEFLNISFGNVQDEEFIDIYDRMKQRFRRPGLNWLCNTENASVVRCARENNIRGFPIKKDKSKSIIDNLDPGPEVPLYKKMRLCEKLQ